MMTKAAVSVLVLAGVGLLGPVVRAGEPVYVPFPVADKIKTIETTQLDVGEAQLIFDNNKDTLVRTPAINPAFVRVEFTEPIRVEYIRVRFSGDEHDWSVAAADSLAELRDKGGSYRVLLADQKTGRSGEAGVKLGQPAEVRALQLDVRRKTGDDYVHIVDWEFCRPAQVDKLRVQYVDKRAVAHRGAELKDVPEKLTRLVDSIVWFKAQAVAQGADLDISGNVQWRPADDGLVALADEPGQFNVAQAGPHALVAQYGDFQQTITVVGEPRTLKNRKADIEIWFIERLPRIDYDGPNEGWPAAGSDVTWRGHVYNWGEQDVPIKYEWKLDGKTIAQGEKLIPAGPPGTAAATIDWPWKCEKKRHDLTLTVTPAAPLEELIAANNTLTVQTDAITVGFWVERSLWEFFHENQYRLPTHDANSFAGWAQRMMGRWNAMFVEAVYPNEYPGGIAERVRLDRLVIVPDNALPLAGGLPSNNPDNRDKTVDLVWGHPSDEIRADSVLEEGHFWSPERAIKLLQDGTIEQRKSDPPFWCGYGFIHELGHARYLVDAYGFNVHSGTAEDVTKRNILVTDEKGPILGRYMRLKDDIQHWQKYPGNMAGSEWRYSIYEAMCWNRVAGRRARGGNCNSPPNIGEFLQDMPTKIVFEYVDTEGKPLADADVWVYRARGTGKDWYPKVYEDQPAIQKKTDARGRVELDRTMFAADGKIVHSFGFSNSVALVRVTHQGRHYFVFEEVTDQNLAYNLGHQDEFVFQRQIKLRSGEPSPEEWKVDARWDVPGTEFGRR